MSLLETVVDHLHPDVFRCSECGELHYRADYQKEMIGTALDAYYCPDCGERVFP